MTRLVTAVRALGLEGDISLSGRWVKLHGERCLVHVIEATWNGGYYTWCDDPKERAIQHYLDPIEALQAGLLRATRVGQDTGDG